jgi:F-type H+-transporting ATPase subunit b
MLQLDLQQILSQALSFLILLWVLRRFAWRPLLGILDGRRRQIEEALQEAARGREDLASLQADYQQQLATIDDEARKKIQQAILDGKRIALEIQEQARAQAHTVVEKSKETIALELAKAKVTLRDEVAAMTLAAVERILQRKLDAKADRQLVETVLDELDREPSPV